MYKIIFLDIDGVLNGWDNIVKIAGFFKLYKFVDFYGIYFRKMLHLSKIVKKTGAVVVLSSTWRYGWDKIYSKYSRQYWLHWYFDKFNIRVIDITPRLDRRGDEIKWVLDNRWYAEHCKFIILDDEEFNYKDYFGEEFIKTSTNTKSGLTRKHVKKAIEILNR